MSRNAKGFEGTSNLQETDREQPGGGKAVWRWQMNTSPELCQGYRFYGRTFGTAERWEKWRRTPR